MRWPLAVGVSGHGVLCIRDRRSPQKAFLCALSSAAKCLHTFALQIKSNQELFKRRLLGSFIEVSKVYSPKLLVREPATSFHTNSMPIITSPVLRQRRHVQSC